jgi:hypothetical protein
MRPADETALRRLALYRVAWDVHAGRDACLGRFGAGWASSFPGVAGLQRFQDSMPWT